MDKIVVETAGFKHQNNSWEIVKVSVRINDKERQIKWPPRVKYKDKYFYLQKDTLEKRPLYIQEVTCTDLVPVQPETSLADQQIQYLERFCDKQNNQIVALVHKVRELERELINTKKDSNESQT